MRYRSEDLRRMYLSTLNSWAGLLSMRRTAFSNPSLQSLCLHEYRSDSLHPLLTLFRHPDRVTPHIFQFTLRKLASVAESIVWCKGISSSMIIQLGGIELFGPKKRIGFQLSGVFKHDWHGVAGFAWLGVAQSTSPGSDSLETLDRMALNPVYMGHGMGQLRGMLEAILEWAVESPLSGQTDSDFLGDMYHMGLLTKEENTCSCVHGNDCVMKGFFPGHVYFAMGVQDCCREYSRAKPLCTFRAMCLFCVIRILYKYDGPIEVLPEALKCTACMRDFSQKNPKKAERVSRRLHKDKLMGIMLHLMDQKTLFLELSRVSMMEVLHAGRFGIFSEGAFKSDALSAYTKLYLGVKYPSEQFKSRGAGVLLSSVHSHPEFEDFETPLCQKFHPVLLWMYWIYVYAELMGGPTEKEKTVSDTHFGKYQVNENRDLFKAPSPDMKFSINWESRGPTARLAPEFTVSEAVKGLLQHQANCKLRPFLLQQLIAFASDDHKVIGAAYFGGGPLKLILPTDGAINAIRNEADGILRVAKDMVSCIPEESPEPPAKRHRSAPEEQQQIPVPGPKTTKGVAKEAFRVLKELMGHGWGLDESSINEKSMGEVADILKKNPINNSLPAKGIPFSYRACRVPGNPREGSSAGQASGGTADSTELNSNGDGSLLLSEDNLLNDPWTSTGFGDEDNS